MVAKHNWTIKQGSTWRKTFYYEEEDGTPINLAGFSAKMQIRESYNSPVLITLTTDNSKIIITPVEGKIVLYLTRSETAALNFDKAVYDLDIYQGDEIKTLLEGCVVLNKQVTRNV